MRVNPLVSIIIPVYNRAVLLAETLQSIKAQSYENWEAILVDDGSSDNSVEVIEAFAVEDKRVRLKRREVLPKGAQNCRNIGLNEAIGEYLIFVDSDDLLDSFCLEQRVACIEGDNQFDFIVFPQLTFSKTPGDSNQLINIRTGESALNRFWTFSYYLDVPWINGGPIFKRKSLLNNLIEWDTKLYGFQDVAFHIECLIAGMKFKYADCKPDYYYRIHMEKRIGDSIFSINTLLSTEEMLTGIFEKTKMKGILTMELKKRIVRSFFHTLIRKFIQQERSVLAYNTLNKMKKKGMVSTMLFCQIWLYIYLYTSFKRYDSLLNKIFFKLWGKSIFERMSENYLKHHYKNGIS